MIGWPQVLMQITSMYAGTKMALFAEANMREEVGKLGIFVHKMEAACGAEDLYEVIRLIDAEAGE
jgi:hypothetical protein